jgi:hypothetical protein
VDAVGKLEVRCVRLKASLPPQLGCLCEDDLGEFGTGGVSGVGSAGDAANACGCRSALPLSADLLASGVLDAEAAAWSAMPI